MRIILLQNGRALRTHQHDGSLYVEVPLSGDYVVRLENDAASRKLVVLAVDGINVLDGKDASHDGPGYVLAPWQTLDVPGWSRGNEKVAAFSFREEGESYAAKTGRGTGNVGVVGVAVYEEKVRAATLIKNVHHWHYHQPPQPDLRWLPTGITWGSGVDDPLIGAYCSTNASPTRSMDSATVASVQDVGTAYGQEVAFQTHDVAFERATTSPSQVIELRYATRERLKAMGVPVDEAPSPTKVPRAFPAAKGCPAPVGWSGR